MSQALVLSFSRNNPITSGHQKLFQAANKLGKQKGALVKCYMSQTHNNKKDPIPYNKKVNLTKKLMPDLADQFVIDNSVRSLINALEVNSNPDINVYFVAGSDRLQEYDRVLNKYNGKNYTFKSITIISAGERDPDGEGPVGISGTKMRAYAESGNYKLFAKGAPLNAPGEIIKEMYNLVRDYLGVNIKITEDVNIMTTGKMYYSGGQYTDALGNFDYFSGSVLEGISFAQEHNYMFRKIPGAEAFEDIILEARNKLLNKSKKKDSDATVVIGKAKNQVKVNPSMHEYGKN